MSTIQAALQIYGANPSALIHMDVKEYKGTYMR
jgi:hypothetical protein